MASFLRIFTLCLLSLSLTGMGSLFAGDLKPVKITSWDYMPYTSTLGPGKGGIQDIIAQAFAKSNVAVEWVYNDWADGVKLVDKGTVFGTTPYFWNAERAQKYNYSAPIIQANNRWFCLKSKFPQGFDWKTLKDFKPYRIGGVAGYWYEPAFKKAELNFTTRPSDRHNMEALLTGQIDFLVLDEVTGVTLAVDEFPREFRKLTMLKKAESFAPFHIMISRDYPDSDAYLKAFNEGLKKLKASGEYAKLLAKHQFPEHYGVPDKPAAPVPAK